MGSAVLNTLSGTLISNIGYRYSYLVLAGIVLIAGALVRIFVRNRPEDVGQEPLRPLEESRDDSPKVLPGVTLKEALRSPAFYLLFIGGIFGPKDFTAIQSYLIPGMNVGLAISAFVAAPFVGSDGSVVGCFRLFACCAAAWMILAFISATVSPYSGKTNN